MPTHGTRRAAMLVCLAVLIAISGGSLAIAAPAVSAPGIITLGLDGWEVQSSAVVSGGGPVASSPLDGATDWLHVRPDDAGAPGTEIEALLQNGACPDVFYSRNMRQCFGYEPRVGRGTIPRFAVPWWFRTVFTTHLDRGEHARLIVNGVVGSADVWVDGVKLAGNDTVQGAFTRYSFDVSALLHDGANAVALEVHPNDPLKMFTLDNVDWTQVPPDNNTGIQFPVQLSVERALSVGNTHVEQHNASDLSSSALTVRTDVTNSSGTTQDGTIIASVTAPGGGSIRLTRQVTVPAGGTRTVTFAPAEYPILRIAHPQLWWPYQLGGQPLYTLSTSVINDGMQSDAPAEQFGIRTVSSYLTPPSSLAKQGVRLYAVNGVPLLFRAGGWSEDLFLHYSSRDLANQITLLRGLGLNAIRTEGHAMPDDFYAQMDRAGIMIDAGYQCCDRWQLPPNGGGVSTEDYRILYLSALTLGERLRDHASVVTFSWSDNAPTPRQELVSLQGFQQAGFEVPLVSSAEYRSSPILGPSGEKEGPYDWVPPSYWYDTTHGNPGDPTLTNAGGSWGFDSEQSAGDTVPTLDSLRRFLSNTDLTELWTDPAFNQYHTNYEPGHNGYAFGTLFNLDAAIRHRYGRWSSLAQYVEEAQLQNYEDTRAQFEAFIAHWANSPTPATGTVYWQVNKGWPTLLWALYNQDYDVAGSYFGASAANRPLHVLYAQDTGTVVIDNLTGALQSGLTVSSRVYDLRGNMLDAQTAQAGSVASQGVRGGLLEPRVPAATAPPAAAQTYFIELTLRQRGAVVDRNVYWLSTQRDLIDWRATIGSPQATMRQYGDLQQLRELPSAAVSVRASTARAGGRLVTTVRVTNTSTSPTVALFIRADVRRGAADGTELSGDNTVLPIIWSADDITLWPGETQAITAAYDAAQLHGASPTVSVYGWNVHRFDVSAAQS